jgi:hypothetical protein
LKEGLRFHAYDAVVDDGVNFSNVLSGSMSLPPIFADQVLKVMPGATVFWPRRRRSGRFWARSSCRSGR